MDLQQSEVKQNDDLKDSLINDSLPDYNGSSQREGENFRSADQIQESKLDSMSGDASHELDYLIDFRDKGYKKYYDELLRIQSQFTKERANFLQATGIDKPVQLAIRTTFNDKTRYDQIKQLKQDAYEMAKDNQAFRKQLESKRRQLKLIEIEIQAHEQVKGKQQELLSRPIDSQEGLKHISPQKIQSKLQRIMTADSSKQLEKMRPYFEAMIKQQRQKRSKTALNTEQMERNLRFYQQVLEKYENSRNTENEDDEVRKIEILIQNQLSTQKHLEKYIQRADTDIKFYKTKCNNNSR